MARELYNWDQLKGYAILGLFNLLNNKGIYIDIGEYEVELDSLQSKYGKDSVIGISRRYLKKQKKLR